MRITRTSTLDIVIPTKGRYLQLLGCIASICKNTQKPNKIIIVDSTVNPDKTTLQLIKSLCLGFGISIKIKHVLSKGPSYSRNIALSLSQSSHIAFIDDDERIPKNYIKDVQIFFANHSRYEVLGGPTVPSFPNNYWSKVAYSIEDYPKNDGPRNFTSGGNSCYNLAFLKNHNLLFDERLRCAEDHAFSNLLNLKRANIFFMKKVFVYHDSRTKLIPFVKQWINYGKGMHQFHFYYLNSGCFSRPLHLKTTIQNLSVFYPFLPKKIEPALLPGYLILNLSWLLGFIYSFIYTK